MADRLTVDQVKQLWLELYGDTATEQGAKTIADNWDAKDGNQDGYVSYNNLSGDVMQAAKEKGWIERSWLETANVLLFGSDGKVAWSGVLGQAYGTTLTSGVVIDSIIPGIAGAGIEYVNSDGTWLSKEAATDAFTGFVTAYTASFGSACTRYAAGSTGNSVMGGVVFVGGNVFVFGATQNMHDWMDGYFNYQSAQ
ncbi:hypothetical protein K1X76_12860 [bacterium]|nr:hypothetical protein [bacterium]